MTQKSVPYSPLPPPSAARKKRNTKKVIMYVPVMMYANAYVATYVL